MWENGILGDDNPESLVRTCWLQTTMHFGWRGRNEQRKVCFGDLKLTSDLEEDREYVEFCVERGTKTTHGLEGQHDRLFSPRMYATGTKRCPVSIFKKVIAHRPPEMMKPDDPFFLATIPNPKSEIWFKKQPMGVTKLGNIMKEIAKEGHLQGKKTNHSARKTMIRRLVEKDVSPLMIAQLSGHKNLKSLDSYSHASVTQQRSMSLLISGQENSVHKSSSATSYGGVARQDVTYTQAQRHTSSSSLSLMNGANISGGTITVNVYNDRTQESPQAPQRKRIRALIDSDSEEET